MCLIAFAWQVHPDYPLILAANRDEFHDRPSRPLDYWHDMPDVLGGRDLQKGGSWLAANVDGRWAAVTNFRDGRAAAAANRSRGHLVSDYVASAQSASEYAASIAAPLSEYPGCNLLVGDPQALFFVSNRRTDRSSSLIEPVAAGVHALSNHLLDTPWPKVERSKQRLRDMLSEEGAPLTAELFDLLGDRALASDADLPSTGVALDWERLLSAPFIVSDGYGTRASTVLLVGSDGRVSVDERSFGAGGAELARRAVQFRRSVA